MISTIRDKDKAEQFVKTYQQVTKPLGINMPQQGQICALKGGYPSDFSKALKELDPAVSVHRLIIILLITSSFDAW